MRMGILHCITQHLGEYIDYIEKKGHFTPSNWKFLKTSAN